MGADQQAFSREQLKHNSNWWIVFGCALGLMVSASRSAGAQSLSGNLFGGAGLFKCCDGHTGAWQVGGSVDLPVAPAVSIAADFGLDGPTGDGIVLDRSGYAS